MLDLKEEYYEDGIFRDIEDALYDAGFDVRRFSDAGIMTRNLGWEVRHPDSGEEVQLSCLGTYLDESYLRENYTTIEDRIKELKMMHNIMRHMNNEDAYMRWIVYGIPDGAYEDDYKYIAEDNDDYNEITDWFYKIYKTYHDDGLYIPTAEQEEFAHKVDAKLGLDDIRIFR